MKTILTLYNFHYQDSVSFLGGFRDSRNIKWLEAVIPKSLTGAEDLLLQTNALQLQGFVVQAVQYLKEKTYLCRWIMRHFKKSYFIFLTIKKNKADSCI